MVAGVAEYIEHFAGDLTVFQVYGVGNFFGSSEQTAGTAFYFAFVPIVIDLFQLFQFAVILQSGSLSQSKLERLIVFAVVVSVIATGYVFYHTVGIFGSDALFGQHVYKRLGRRIAEYPFHSVCTVGVFPIPFVIAVLCQIAEPVLAPCGVAFAGYGAETVIVSVIP